MRKYLVLIAMLTVVLSACRVETNVTLDISEDGSAVVGAEVGFDDEFEQLISDTGASPDDLFGDLPSVGDDVVTTERTEGEMTFYGVASTVDDLSNFSGASAQLETFTSFSYSFDDNGAQLDAELMAADLGDTGGLGEIGFDPSMITDEFFSANVVVKMPGSVTESNADEVRSDGTLVWAVPLSGAKTITATSEFGSSTGNLLLLVLLGVLALGIIATVVAIIVSRRQSQAAVAAAAASHGAPVSATAATATVASDPAMNDVAAGEATDAPASVDGFADADASPTESPASATTGDRVDVTDEDEGDQPAST